MNARSDNHLTQWEVETNTEPTINYNGKQLIEFMIYNELKIMNKLDEN